jgi:hypothetical protein
MREHESLKMDSLEDRNIFHFNVTAYPKKVYDL